MFSQSKIAILFVVLAVAAVEGFAPVAQPRIASSTELGVSFLKKAAEKSVETEAVAPKKKFSFGAKKTEAKKEEAVAPKKKFSFGAKKTEAKKEEAVAPKKKFSFGAKKTEAKAAPVKKVKVVAKKAAPVKKVKVVAKKIVVAKKAAPVKKVVAKKVVAKKTVAKKTVAKNNFASAAPAKKNNFVIYEKQCHIN